MRRIFTIPTAPDCPSARCISYAQWRHCYKMGQNEENNYCYPMTQRNVWLRYKYSKHNSTAPMSTRGPYKLLGVVSAEKLEIRCIRRIILYQCQRSKIGFEISRSGTGIYMWRAYHRLNIFLKQSYRKTMEVNYLTHWGRVMHICVNKLTIIGSDNGLLPAGAKQLSETMMEYC